MADLIAHLACLQELLEQVLGYCGARELGALEVSQPPPRCPPPSLALPSPSSPSQP